MKRRTAYEYREITIALLRERDGDNCGICGKVIEAYDDFSIDHIEDRSTGGSNDPDNIQLAHLTCNQRKKRTSPNAICGNGHDLTNDDNIYVAPDGRHQCRPCNTVRARNYRKRDRRGAHA